MPRTIAEAVGRIDDAIPPGKAAAWDAVGLQVGDPNAPATRIGVCHEVTAEVVEAAIEARLGLLVAYHPLLFTPATRFVAGTAPPGRAFALVRAGIALHVVHTAFDVIAGGAADMLAAALGLVEVRGFGTTWPGDSSKLVTFAPGEAAADLIAAMAGAGAGRIGSYTDCSFTIDGTGSFRPGIAADPLVGTRGELSREAEVRIEMNLPTGVIDGVVSALVAAHPYDEAAYDVYPLRANAGFAGRVGAPGGGAEMSLAALNGVVSKALGTSPRLAGDPERTVRRVAVVPGSGSALLADAIAAGADVLVTGDVSHHRAREALNKGMAVIDAGHAATERPGVAKLYSLVSTMFEDIVDLTHLDPTPWSAA